MFVLAKGAQSYMDNTWPCVTAYGGMFGLTYTDCSALNNAAAWIAAVVAAGIAVTFGVGFMLYVRRMVLSSAKNTSPEEGDVAK